MSEVPRFWEREDLFREDGRCVYAVLCGHCEEGCNPEGCCLWDAFFDGECQGDEVLSE